jgi:misacylated tRNA(Ala) deacylase
VFPNQGRLQTSEHILARTLEHKFDGSRFIISKFDENIGRIEIACSEDLRKIDLSEIQKAVNSVISRSLPVTKSFLKRQDAEKEFDLARLPADVKEVRIVDIEGFDKTPCKDPHVENTGEIGVFSILKVERVGRDRYRFNFKVE